MRKKHKQTLVTSTISTASFLFIYVLTFQHPPQRYNDISYKKSMLQTRLASISNKNTPKPKNEQKLSLAKNSSKKESIKSN